MKLDRKEDRMEERGIVEANEDHLALHVTILCQNGAQSSTNLCENCVHVWQDAEDTSIDVWPMTLERKVVDVDDKIPDSRFEIVAKIHHCRFDDSAQ